MTTLTNPTGKDLVCGPSEKETSNSQKTDTEEPKGMGGGQWEIGDHLFYNKYFSILRFKLCACISIKIVIQFLFERTDDYNYDF